MSRALLCVLSAAALLAGCGQDQLIGRSCEGPECEEGHLEPPPVCGQQIKLKNELVAPKGQLQRCLLFTLDGLRPPPGSDRVYIISVDIAPAPFPHSHDLDLQLAAELPDDLGDGEYTDCTDLTGIAIPWLPLMTTFGETKPSTAPGDPSVYDHWSFGDAPLVVGKNYRLFVNDAFFNAGENTVGAGVTINLTCTDVKPAMVSQTFEMTTGTSLVVNIGARDAELHGNCSFEQDVIVSRFYRRTRLISSFLVTRFEDDQIVGKPLWDSKRDWVLDLDPPLFFHGGEDLFWQCNYRNDGDMAFTVKGNTADACSLFGLYRLPDGSADPVPDHCRR